MKYVFAGTLIIMLGLSALAWWYRPIDAVQDKTELIWVTDDNPVRREQTALFNRLYPQYHLRIDPQNLGMEKVIIQCLAGVGPDIFDCYTPFQLSAYVRSGIARDCTDDLAKRGVDSEAVWPCLKPLFILNDRVYGHPGNANAQALWYNKKLFDAAGEPYPRHDWTWQDVIEAAKRLTKRNARGVPEQFGLLISDGDWQTTFIPQWGGRYYTPEGTRCILDSPEACQAAQFYQDLIYTHQVVPTPSSEEAMASTGGWASGVASLFGAGKAAMAVGGRWWLCIFRNKDYRDLALGAVEMPTGPTRTIYGGGRTSLINAKGKHLEGALTFLKFMHGQAWNELINQQADALGPVMQYSDTDAYRYNPAFPAEDYNEVWRHALETALPMPSCPFANGKAVDRILLMQSDLLRAHVKTGEQAMRDAAKAINQNIVEQLRLDPEAKTVYMKAVAAGARPAWDNPEEAP